MSELSSNMLIKAKYFQWFARERGKTLKITKWGLLLYVLRIITTSFWGIVSSVDIFQASLQYLMSILYLKSFVADKGIHNYSEACNNIAGFVGVDKGIAVLTSMVFWIIALSAVYEVANILVPGLPPGTKPFDSVDTTVEDFRSRFGIHKWLKVFRFGSPDLLWASIVGYNIQTSIHDIPCSAGFFVNSIKDVEVAESAASERQKKQIILTVDNDTSFTEAHKGEYTNASSDVEKISMRSESRLIAAVEQPMFPAFRVEVSPIDGYIAFERCAKEIRNTKIWQSEYFDKAITGIKCILFKLLRCTGELEFTETYDIVTNGFWTHGRSRSDLAAELNQTSDRYVIVVAVSQIPTLGHKEDGLLEAMYRCGASEAGFASKPHRNGYILVGVPGCGAGMGFEVTTKKKSEIGTKLCLDFSLMDNSRGFKIIEALTSGRNFIDSSIAERTNEENLKWKDQKVKRMPTFWSLSLKEYDELKQRMCRGTWLTFFETPMCTLLVLLGLGHFLTEVGRRAWWAILWKYARFLQVALGIWTDDLVNVFRIHEIVHQASTVWYEPRVVADVLQSKGTKSYVPAELLQSDSNEYSQNKQEHFDDRKKFLENEEGLSTHLKQDYGLALYGTVGPRATLLQLIPYVSVLSIFASMTAAQPVLTYFCPILESNLISGVLKKRSVEHSRKLKNGEYGFLWDLKQEESRSNSYELPYPNSERKDSDTAEIRAAACIEIDEKNNVSKGIMDRVLMQEKFRVQEWEAYLEAPSNFLNLSRYILFFRGFFKCTVAVTLLYSESDLRNVLAVLCLLVLLPFAVADALMVAVRIGHALCISDTDLYNELGWLYRFFEHMKSKFCVCLGILTATTSATSTCEGIITDVEMQDSPKIRNADEQVSAAGDKEEPRVDRSSLSAFDMDEYCGYGEEENLENEAQATDFISNPMVFNPTGTNRSSLAALESDTGVAYPEKIHFVPASTHVLNPLAMRPGFLTSNRKGKSQLLSKRSLNPQSDSTKSLSTVKIVNATGEIYTVSNEGNDTYPNL